MKRQILPALGIAFAAAMVSCESSEHAVIIGETPVRPVVRKPTMVSATTAPAPKLKELPPPAPKLKAQVSGSASVAQNAPDDVVAQNAPDNVVAQNAPSVRPHNQPFYFLPEQGQGMAYVEPFVRKSYEKFCREGSYPHTLGSWYDPNVIGMEGTCHVIISLSAQRGILFIDNKLALDFPVCSGKPSTPTPAGNFRVTQKDPNHYSYKYNAPMKCFMRLTDYGVGLHIGPVESKPASHGCIRLPEEACRMLYKRMPMGGAVTIIR